MKLEVYTKTVCPQCTPIKIYMNRNDIKYDMHNIDTDEKAYKKVIDMGMQSAPVLVLSDENGNVVKTSSGQAAALDIMNWHKEGLI